MATKAEATRIEFYVWALAALALVAAISVGWIFRCLLDDVALRREVTMKEFDRSREAIALLQSELFTIRADFDRVLHGTGVSALLDYQHGRDAIEHCRVGRADHALDAEHEALLERDLTEISELLDQAFRARRTSAELSLAIEESERVVRKRIGALRADVELLAGRNRLARVSALLEAQDKASESANTIASLDVDYLRSEYSEVRFEVSDLTEYALRLSIEPEIDNLADIKHNGLTQSLKRLRRMVTSFRREPGDASTLDGETIDAIEQALLGDPSTPTSSPSPSIELGLYELRTRYLTSVAAQQGLEAKASTVTSHARDHIDSLAESLRNDFLEATRHTERAMRSAQLRMGGIGAGALALFVLASAWITSAIRKQVRALHAAMSELNRANMAHEAALAQVSLLSAGIRAAPSPMMITDCDARVTWINPAYCQWMGWDPDQVPTTVHVGQSGAPLGTSRATQATSAQPSHDPWRAEVQQTRPDGSVRIGDQTVTPLVDKSNVVRHYITIVHDVTDERRAADMLRASHDETTLVLRSVASILIGFTPDKRVRRWGSRAEEVLGKTAVEADGAALSDLGLSWDATKIEEAIGKCCSTNAEVRIDDISFVRSDKSSGVLAISLNPMRDANGDNCGCVLLGRDITERRHLEMQLTRAQKLESIGQLAAGIAHEINTPTQFISDNTHFVRDSMESLRTVLQGVTKLVKQPSGKPGVDGLDSLAAELAELDVDFLLQEIPRALDDSIEGLDRIRNIVQAMKQFSHPGTGHMDPADINQIVRVTSTVARNEWKYTAKMELVLDPTLPHVPCFEQDLSQVLLNMIVNAAHAIAERKDRPAGSVGTIVITTARDGEYVLIRIQDDGAGIPEAIRHRVFDPFFTTKSVGKGTGQGLAITHAVIIEKHHGTIELESEVGVGSTFSLRIPLAPEKHAAKSAGGSAHVA